MPGRVALAREAVLRRAWLREAVRDHPSLRADVDAFVASHRSAAAGAPPPAWPIEPKRLGAGTRVGPYRIDAFVGKGGMGEVYRARDTTLGRDVAMKVLPPGCLDHPRRSAQLDREARVLAALNHPHIGAIYGLIDADGIRGLVLELVDGPTLADRLRLGPLPLTEALSIARQVANALAAAHETGIVHRDLKPANLKITPNGVVKVLDFGLAKVSAEGEASADAPTMTVAGTDEGRVTGTAAYMSPEQARGKLVDTRTDVWAFGCVLYEMLCGRRAFSGETNSDTIAAILDREPDWAALPRTTPASLRRLLVRCLEKDPRRRLQDAADSHFDIEEALGEAGPAVRAPAGRAPVRNGHRWLLAAGVALPVMAAGAGCLWLKAPAPVQAATALSQAPLQLPMDPPGSVSPLCGR